MRKEASNMPAGVTAINWTLDDMGVLTISGCGKMPDYACGKNPAAPWHDRKGAVDRVVIEDGITEIGVNAFRGCRNLKSVKLPQTVQRICGYAFRDCVRLDSVQSDRSVWRYIYDERQTPEEDTVIFGFESFLNCPWAAAKWDNYYIRDNALYVCFVCCSRLEIPEGIHTLKQFSVTDLAIDEIVFPSTLKYIEKFVFAGTVVRKGICLPEKMEFIDNYALADCCFGSLRLPDGYAPSGMKKKRVSVNGSEKTLDLQRVPEFAGKYYLGTKKIKGSEKFRYMKIMERRPVFHKDGRITSVWNNNYVDVGLTVLHKIQRGSALVYIRYKDEEVLSVKVIAMRETEETIEKSIKEVMPCVYQHYPMTNDGDVYSYYFPYAVRKWFPDCDGAALADNGTLRFVHSDIHEEWFLCTAHDDNWKKLASDALSLWQALHPEMRNCREEVQLRQP